jgi:hypothetical protein
VLVAGAGPRPALAAARERCGLSQAPLASPVVAIRRVRTGEPLTESNPPARLVTPPNWTGQVACAQLELLPVATSAALTIRAQLVTGGWCVVAVKPKVPA